jgi:Leucine-rich repeat (LRR) protein
MKVVINNEERSFESWGEIQTYFNKVGKGKIVTLNFSGNQLSEIAPGTFEGLTSLQTLTLDNNQLPEVVPGTFEGLTSLQWLTLGNNQLSKIQRIFPRC